MRRLATAGAPVTALVPPAEAAASAVELEGAGVHVVTGLGTSAAALAAAGLGAARVLVLAADDDVGNVDTALMARAARPDLRLVVRLFDATLARYLGETLAPITVLSMSGLSAPVFADLAMRVIREPARPAAPRAGAAAQLPTRRGGVTVDRVLLALLGALLVLVAVATAYFSLALRI